MNFPLVKVPVLSNMMMEVLDKFSKATEPLMRIPYFDAEPIPAKKVIGTAMTKAHGQEINKMDKALYRASLPPSTQLKPAKPKPRRKTTIATRRTIGV